VTQARIECPCGFVVMTRGWGSKSTATAAMMYEAHLEEHDGVAHEGLSQTKKSEEPKPFAVGFQREG